MLKSDYQNTRLEKEMVKQRETNTPKLNKKERKKNPKLKSKGGDEYWNRSFEKLTNLRLRVVYSIGLPFGLLSLVAVYVHNSDAE